MQAASKKEKVMTYGSLFSGIGGIDLGLDRAGMKCIWQCEVDPYACRVLEKHWPGVKRYGDITQVNWEEAERPDLICGGFPCQDISFAGKGAGLSGARSGLFYEAIRAVRILRPGYVILENVAALLVRGLDAVLGTLAEVGYDAEWHCIPAAAVGTPHIRDRVFILAYPKSERCKEAWEYRPQQSTKWIHRECSQKVFTNDRSERIQGGKQGTVPRIKSIPWSENVRGAEEWLRRPDLPEPLFRRSGDGVPYWLDRLRCIGNAVVPQIAELIGRSIMETEFG